MSTLSVELPRIGLPTGTKQRLVVKTVKDRDDLDQLYHVIRDAINHHESVIVELWVETSPKDSDETQDSQESQKPAQTKGVGIFDPDINAKYFS